MFLLISIVLLTSLAHAPVSSEWFARAPLQLVGIFFVTTTAIRIAIGSIRVTPLLKRQQLLLAQIGREPNWWDRTKSFVLPSVLKGFLTSFGDTYADGSADLTGWVFGKAINLVGEHVLPEEGPQGGLIRELDQLRERIQRERALTRWFVYGNVLICVIALALAI